MARSLPPVCASRTPSCQGAVVEQPARFEEELALFREEEREPGEVDDLLVGFHLREVRVHSHVGGQGRCEADLSVGAALAAEVTSGRFPADAVVLSFDGATERIRVQLDIVRAAQITEIGDPSFIVEVVEPLRPAV